MKNSFSSQSFESHPQDYKYCPWDGYKFLENDNECQICGHKKQINKVFLKNLLDFLY